MNPEQRQTVADKVHARMAAAGLEPYAETITLPDGFQGLAIVFADPDLMVDGKVPSIPVIISDLDAMVAMDIDDLDGLVNAFVDNAVATFREFTKEKA